MRWWENRGEEVGGGSHTPSTLSRDQSLYPFRRGRAGGWRGKGQGSPLRHVAGSPGRLRSLGKRLSQRLPSPLPEALGTGRAASCTDSSSVSWAGDVLTLLVPASGKAKRNTDVAHTLFCACLPHDVLLNMHLCISGLPNSKPQMA